MDTRLLEIGFVASALGLMATALSSLLGIWIDRDPSRPRRWAIALSFLVLVTQAVAIQELRSNAEESARLQEDMARILESLDQMAAQSEDDGLDTFVEQEIRTQMRANPKVVERMARRYEAKGKDAAAELGRHVDPADLEMMTGAVSKPSKSDDKEKKDKDKGRGAGEGQ